MIDVDGARGTIEALWDREVVPTLVDYIRIPNKSPAFEPDWRRLGHMDEATELLARWARPHVDALGGTLEVVRIEDRTPVIFIEVPGTAPGEVLLYGHLDKQPEMSGWSEGLGPWTPVLRDGRLYGRGGADDGYALFGAVSALRALRAQNVPHARAVVLIEACEESGSFDLPAYVEHLKPRIGRPELVVCLDSGCGDYERLWLTTSLRGMVGALLEVEVLEEGVHSGDASGVVASSFRIARSLLSRIEDEATGRIRLSALEAEIPAVRVEEARAAAAVLGEAVWRKFPFVPGMGPAGDDLVELILNRTWRPALSVVGAAGLPEPRSAGNVLRPRTALKLSLRLPPTVDAPAAAQAVAEALTRDPPYGARVRVEVDKEGSGWHAPPLEPWLREAVARASESAFGQPPLAMGEGGSIPFMGMLGESFPEAQFLITGVLGPHSNAHGPNEFLDLATARRISLAVAGVMAEHGARRRLAAAA